MAFRFRGSCRDCGHEWDGLGRSFECGHVDFGEPETYRTYACPKCFTQLHVPRLLSRTSFLRWVRENATELSRSPLLFRSCELGVRIEEHSLAVIARSPLLLAACEAVARVLAKASSRYLPVAIDIGTIRCTDCGDPMLNGDIGTTTMACPRCDSRSARSLGDRHLESVFVDYRPLDADVVRGVILHLKELAACSESLSSPRSLTEGCAQPSISASAHLVGALWDQELDGGFS